MNKLNPINFENDVLLIHPLRPNDILRQNEIIEDLYEIFSDKDSLPYNKEKYIENKEQIELNLLGITIGYSQNIRYTHFITLKEINKIIGEIIILSPKSVEQSYNIKNIWFLEFYLNKLLWNYGIMTDIITQIVSRMKNQGIIGIGALVDRRNIQSIRVLEKSGFKKNTKFDDRQDYYVI
jgi:RimJ/RimL family protein N-acetyltransferase